MDKVYLLKNCSTCKRIFKEVEELADFEVIDIKENRLTTKEIDAFAKAAGGYEAILNKQSVKYRELGLANQRFEDNAYRAFLIKEYALLKRPVFVIEKKVFVGRSKNVVADLVSFLKARNR